MLAHPLTAGMPTGRGLHMSANLLSSITAARDTSSVHTDILSISDQTTQLTRSMSKRWRCYRQFLLGTWICFFALKEGTSSRIRNDRLLLRHSLKLGVLSLTQHKLGRTPANARNYWGTPGLSFWKSYHKYDIVIVHIHTYFRCEEG